MPTGLAVVVDDTWDEGRRHTHFLGLRHRGRGNCGGCEKLRAFFARDTGASEPPLVMVYPEDTDTADKRVAEYIADLTQFV